MSNISSRLAGYSRLAVMAAAVSFLAACSSDVERLSDYPPVNTTASLPAKAATSRAAPVERVASRPLNGGYSAPATPAWSKPSYTPPAPRTAAVSSGHVTVRPGQTLYSIARANGMSVSRLAAANGLSYPYNLRVGQRLRIPGVSRPVSPAPSFAPAAIASRSPQPQSAPRATPVRAQPERRNYRAARTHRVAPGETIYALGRKYHVKPARIAALNGMSMNTRLKVGQRVRIPSSDGWSMAAPAQGTPPVRTTTVAQTLPQADKDSGRIAPPRPKQPHVRPEPPAPNSESIMQASGFRWPVRGRVISTYGAKPGGVRNEGINIAVPEGADVHAANDGVVAYAGNELKGYGNLVLIRHKGGWVTAYAHNKALFVKRGDRVRRGQVIAKAGSTGSVKTPQLHFELRKGASAVNPLKYLGTATASN